MNNWLRRLPIRHKLIAITLITAALVLASAAATFVVSGMQSQRAIMVKSATVLAEVVGINSTAALAFRDPITADEILAALAAEPQVLSAHIHTAAGCDTNNSITL